MKNHQDKQWLQSQIAMGKSSKQISDENKVSYSLVELYLKQFNIPFTPKVRYKK
jgi:hypothetical protein